MLLKVFRRKLFLILYLALENDLEIIPILNKMDLPGAMPEEVTDQIVDLIGCDPADVIQSKWKNRFGS